MNQVPISVTPDSESVVSFSAAGKKTVINSLAKKLMGSSKFSELANFLNKNDTKKKHLKGEILDFAPSV